MSKTEMMKMTAVATAAPEDLRRGDVVVRTYATCQVLRSTDDAMGDRPAYVVERVRYVPCDAGEPLRVEAVCLPFIYAVRPDEGADAIDLRMQTIAKLPRKAGGRAFKAMTPRWVRDRKKKKQKKGKKNS
ncbi:MAG: hypothetical protein AAF078_04835 [Planctomycetota bacterium]